MAKKAIQKIDDKDLIRHKLLHEKKSTLARYSDLVIGEGSLLRLMKYELITTLLGPIPGALGLLLRKLFYPWLFKHIGKGVVFGRNVVIRHPERIRLGNRVIIDDYALIDARGAGEEGIVIGDDVIINRGVSIQAKVGPVRIGASTNVGASTSIISMGGVEIGEMVSLAGGCWVSGGAFSMERDQSSYREHGKYTKGPVRLGRKSRFGLGVIVLDGAHVGEGCVVGARSLVVSDLPRYSIASGTPARVRRSREAIQAKG